MIWTQCIQTVGETYKKIFLKIPKYYAFINFIYVSYTCMVLHFSPLLIASVAILVIMANSDS